MSIYSGYKNKETKEITENTIYEKSHGKINEVTKKIDIKISIKETPTTVLIRKIVRRIIVILFERRLHPGKREEIT